MLNLDDGLKALLQEGKYKGYLTYSQVNDHLPDDDANPEKIDLLLTMLEAEGIELIDEADVDEREHPRAGEVGADDVAQLEGELAFLDEEDSRRIDDPVRM